jgi:fructan beta-fructosidase
MTLVFFLMLAGGDDVLLSDFEGKDYGAWTVTGAAFGTGPARGTLPHQMPVSGFQGKGLVNSYLGGDGAVGTLTSPSFTIERKAISFLIGGGEHPGETCINLLVDGKMVRTSTGKNSEHLEWESWDVAGFSGRTATIEIVDRAVGGWGHINIDHIVQSEKSLKAGPQVREIAIDRRYLHLPVKTGAPKRRMKLQVGAEVVREFEIELIERDPQFWAIVDLQAWKGKTLRLEVWGPADAKNSLEAVTQGDEIRTVAPLYAERHRPQVHFTSRRGWLNDPNGMVFFQGEYHLFYQHNPYGWAWGNMHWGHAVSKDLVHWEELPIAIHPAKFGDWAFSGSAVVDGANTGGFKTGEEDVLVAAYTSTGRGECIVTSNDRGRTWTEYAGNPVVKHQGRDPRLLWHAPSSQWVMAVYHEEGKKQSIAFHTSPDLKTWTHRSTIDGFYECPDLFELPVDGDGAKARWVLLAADGRYVLGSFDGREFKPEGDKKTVWHGSFYASQTFSNAPGHRRIQIGWARGTDFPDMPFNQQMNVPVELTLKTAADGVRMLAMPVKEIELLRGEKREWKNFDMNQKTVVDASAEPADVEMTFRPGTAEHIYIGVRDIFLVYDVKRQQLASRNNKASLPPIDGVVRLRAIIDRGSVEVFGNGGLVAMCIPVLSKFTGYSFKADGGNAQVDSFELWPLRSTWK